MRRLIVGLLFGLLALPAYGQVTNPSRIELKDEGTSKGRIFSLDCIGAELVCVATGGVATITHTPTLVPFALGGTGLSSAADDTTLVSSGSAWAAKALPDCVDSAGNHLNYTASSNAFSCGTSGSASLPVVDTTAVVKGSADPTKTALFEVDGFTTANARVFTLPGLTGNDTIATLAAPTNTFTGAIANPGSGPSSERFGVGATATQSGSLALGNGAASTGSNAIAIGQVATANAACIAIGVASSCGGFSHTAVFGTSVVATGPNQLVIGGPGLDIRDIYFGRGVANNSVFVTTLHGTGGSGTDLPGGGYAIAGGQGTGTAAGGNVSVQTSPSGTTGSTANALSDRGAVVAKAKALTAGAATSFVRIGLPALSMAGGVVEYSIQASDGTDMQSLSGLLPFSVVNKGSVETCTIGVTGTQNETLVASSSGTLTNTFTCSTTPANAVDLQANAASSLTETVLQIVYQVRLNGAVGTTTITPQ